MFTLRKFLYVLAALMLAACSTLPARVPADPVAGKAPDPTSPLAKPGTLAASIPAVTWKGNTEGHKLVPIDPATGENLPGYEPISLGQSYSHVFSPDGHTLAMVGFVSSEYPRGGSLHLIDLETWEERVQELRLDAYVNAMDFSPDGERLAIAYGNNNSQILLINVTDPPAKSKNAALQTSMDFLITTMKFTTDGSGLIIYGYRTENPSTVNQQNPDPPIVALFASSDLSVSWSANLEGIRHGILPKDESSSEQVDFTQPGQAIYLFPGLAFAPEHDVLYVVHADEDKLTTVDFAAQEIGSVEITPELSWMERLLSLTSGVAHAKVAEGTSKRAVVSPDGEYLFIVGQHSDLIEGKDGEWQISENPLGLQIVRTEGGSRLGYYDTDAMELSISDDGRHLHLRGWGEIQGSAWTQVFDTEAYRFKVRMDGMWLMPVHRLNGDPILASSIWVDINRTHHNATVDPKNLSVLAEWTTSDYLGWLTVR